MIEKTKESWREFKKGKPGHRFHDHYLRRREKEEGHIVKRMLLIALGVIIAIGSLVLSPLPGPGWGTAFIGLMILGGELLPVARSLDWVEVRLRKLGRFVGKVWRSSVVGKAVVVVVAVAIVAATFYITYWLFFGG